MGLDNKGSNPAGLDVQLVFHLGRYLQLFLTNLTPYKPNFMLKHVLPMSKYLNKAGRINQRINRQHDKNFETLNFCQQHWIDGFLFLPPSRGYNGCIDKKYKKA